MRADLAKCRHVRGLQVAIGGVFAAGWRAQHDGPWFLAEIARVSNRACVTGLIQLRCPSYEGYRAVLPRELRCVQPK